VTVPGRDDASGGRKPSGAPSLEVVQRWFQSVVTHPGGVDEGAAAEDAQALIRLDRGELEAVVRRSNRLTATERLSIYANAYYARLLECMGACFPVLRQTLGGELFESFAFEYLQRYPSRSYTLDRLGESFPRFLAETRPEREGAGEPDWADFFVDLATLEWAIAQVFDGPGVEGQPLLSPADLLAVPAERFASMRLVPVACLRLLAFRFPVNDHFTAVRRAGEGGEAPLLPPARTEHLALLRRDFVVRRYPVQAAQCALLQAIQGGASVGEAIAVAAEESGLDDEHLAAELRVWFRFWAAEGFFQAVAT
jgi:hypothetical protein